MRHLQQLNRSGFTISMLALMLLVSFAGVSFADDAKVDLNAGTAKELQQLPGIGKGLAQRIVDYRTANGPFKNVEEVMKVKGIGKKTFAKMKDRLTVGAAEPTGDSQ